MHSGGASGRLPESASHIIALVCKLSHLFRHETLNETSPSLRVCLGRDLCGAVARSLGCPPGTALLQQRGRNGQDPRPTCTGSDQALRNRHRCGKRLADLGARNSGELSPDHGLPPGAALSRADFVARRPASSRPKLDTRGSGILPPDDRLSRSAPEIRRRLVSPWRAGSPGCGRSLFCTESYRSNRVVAYRQNG